MKPRSAFIAALLATGFAHQSFAAARAHDVDPARDIVGQIVYPLGVHPPKDTPGGTKMVHAHDKISKTVKHPTPDKDADQQ